MNPYLEVYSQSGAEPESCWTFCDIPRVVFHDKFPAIYLRLDFSNNSLEFDILKLKSLENLKLDLKLYALVKDLEFEKQRRKTKKRWRKENNTSVTLNKNECFEANILDNLKPEQRRDNLFILYFCWLSQKQTEEREPD